MSKTQAIDLRASNTVIQAPKPQGISTQTKMILGISLAALIILAAVFLEIKYGTVSYTLRLVIANPIVTTLLVIVLLAVCYMVFLKPKHVDLKREDTQIGKLKANLKKLEEERERTRTQKITYLNESSSGNIVFNQHQFDVYDLNERLLDGNVRSTQAKIYHATRALEERHS